MYSLYNVFSFETLCNNIIDEELNTFLKNRLDSAYSYSLKLCKDPKSYSKGEFKDTIINKVDLIFLFTYVIEKISYELELSEDLSTDTNDYNTSNIGIDLYVNQTRFHDHLINTCDVLADEIVAHSFNSIGHTIFSFEIKENAETLSNQHQDIYKKLSDSLIESKPKIKELLVNFTLKNSIPSYNSSSKKYVS
ncbi:hypothetical protein [Clostridium sp. DL1XJH146]